MKFLLLFMITTLVCCNAKNMFEKAVDVVKDPKKIWTEPARDLSTSLVGPAKDAYLEAMSETSKEVEKIMKHVDGMKENIDSLGRISTSLQAGLLKIVRDASQHAQSFVDGTVDQIKHELIDYTLHQLHDFSKEVADDIGKVLNESFCKAFTGPLEYLDGLKRVLLSLPINPLDPCRREFGIELTPLWLVEEERYYRFRKCSIISKANENSPITELIGIYLSLEKLAYGYYCLNHAPGNRYFYLQEAYEAQEKFHLWDRLLTNSRTDLLLIN